MKEIKSLKDLPSASCENKSKPDGVCCLLGDACGGDLSHCFDIVNTKDLRKAAIDRVRFHGNLLGCRWGLVNDDGENLIWTERKMDTQILNSQQSLGRMRELCDFFNLTEEEVNYLNCVCLSPKRINHGLSNNCPKCGCFKIIDEKITCACG